MEKGKVRSSGGFTFLQVYEAGHMVRQSATMHHTQPTSTALSCKPGLVLIDSMSVRCCRLMQVPMDQPEASLAMLDSFIAQEPLAITATL